MLVTNLDASYFKQTVPYLILLATLLFMSQPLLSRWVGVGKHHEAPSRLTLVGIVVFQFFVAIYGGYFGAGIGILMLSALSLMGFEDIHRMNALKTLLAAVINTVSVALFIAYGKVVWHFGLVMAVAAIAGGYAGAAGARHRTAPWCAGLSARLASACRRTTSPNRWAGSLELASLASVDLQELDFKNQI